MKWVVQKEKFKNICPKCAHFQTCESPCYPVKQYLAEDNLSVFEKTYTNKEGKTVSIVFARSREIPESDLPQVFEDTSIPADKPQRVFSTESENPFKSFNAKHKQTGVFVDRFFNDFSYDDLAIKYNVTVHTAVTMYSNALKRILKVLEEMDKASKREQYVKQVEERSGHLTKSQRWFLLNKLLGFLPSEIAEMEGLKRSSAVRQLIIRVGDQLQAGEIRLIDATPEEAHAAKARLNVHRSKRRERYSQKKRDK